MGPPIHAALVILQASSSSGQGGLLTNPWFYAVLSAVSLAIGSAVAIWVDPERRWQAALLAVGGGSLVVSLAFELYDPAVHTVGRWTASGYFLGGVAVFGGLDILIDRWLDDETKENGWGLWASVTTDGIPENAAMGSLLTGQVHGAMAFLFALVVTNDSQSMMAATNMTENHSDWVTLGAWVATGVVVGASVMAGYWFLPSLPRYWLGALRAFAGGAILASLAGEIYPDAYEDGGYGVAFNHDHPDFGRRPVRRAVAHAVDRSEVAQNSGAETKRLVDVVTGVTSAVSDRWFGDAADSFTHYGTDADRDAPEGGGVREAGRGPARTALCPRMYPRSSSMSSRASSSVDPFAFAITSS